MNLLYSFGFTNTLPKGLKRTEHQADLIFSADFERKIEHMQYIHRNLLEVLTNAKEAFDRDSLKEYMTEMVKEKKLLEAYKLLQFSLRARLKHNAVMILYYSHCDKPKYFSEEINDFKSFCIEMTKFYEALESKNKSKIKLEFDKNGESQIHLAAKHGWAIEVEFFIRIFEENANPERKKISRLFGGTEELQKQAFITPFHEALRNKHLECLNLLEKSYRSSPQRPVRQRVVFRDQVCIDIRQRLLPFVCSIGIWQARNSGLTQ